MNVGLLTTTASVYQMMRGAEMLFAAMLAVLFLHRRLNKYNYLGLLASTVRRVGYRGKADKRGLGNTTGGTACTGSCSSRSACGSACLDAGSVSGCWQL